MTTAENQDCKICQMEESDSDNRVFSDEHWAAEVPSGLEVPGWFFLRTRRHAELITGLNTVETETFGQHAKDMVSAVERATGAPAVYLMSFGENHRHFHALITARGEEVPAEERGGGIVKTAKDHIDPEAATAIARKVKTAYNGIVAERN